MFKNFNNVCKYNCVVVDNNVAIVVTSHLICSWICTVCSSTLTRTEKGFAPDVEHVGVPHVVMAEKGQIFVTLQFFSQVREPWCQWHHGSHKIWPNGAEIERQYAHISLSASGLIQKDILGLKRAPHKSKIGLRGCLCTLLNALKICRFAALFGHPAVKEFSALGGFCPLTDQGLCPWTPLGASPPDPHMAHALHGLPSLLLANAEVLFPHSLSLFIIIYQLLCFSSELLILLL